LVGGRGNKGTNICNPVSRTWSKGAAPPMQEMHHMQCVAAQGKLWVMAAWTACFPMEENAPNACVHDPATNVWATKTAIPVDRRRGAAAVVVSADESKTHVSHGNSGGHETGNHTALLGHLDACDISTDTWTALSSNAPNPRDHVGGALIDGRICVAGGGDGGELNSPSVGPTDCYNLHQRASCSNFRHDIVPVEHSTKCWNSMPDCSTA
jgi:hypothetical protein